MDTSSRTTIDTLMYFGNRMFNNEDPINEMQLRKETYDSNVTYLNERHTYTNMFYTSPVLAKYFIQIQTHLPVPSIQIINIIQKFFKTALEKDESAFYKLEERDSVIACKFRSEKDKARE